MAHLSAVAQPARATKATLARSPAGCMSPAGKNGLLPRPSLKAVQCSPLAAAASTSLLPRPAHQSNQAASNYLEDKYGRLCQFVETNSVVQIPEGKSLRDAEVALKLPKAPESAPVQQSWWQLSFDEDHGLAAC